MLGQCNFCVNKNTWACDSWKTSKEKICNTFKPDYNKMPEELQIKIQLALAEYLTEE